MGSTAARTRGAWACALALTIVGCGAEETETQATPPPTRTPTPYVPDLPPDEAQSATLDDATLQQVLAAQVPALLQADLRAVPDIVEGFVDLTDPECPAAQVQGEGDFAVLVVESDCVNGDGVRIRGYLNITRVVEDGGAVVNVSMEGGGLRMEAPDGRFVEVGGYMGAHEARFDDVRETGAYLGARLRADPETAAGNPFLDGTFGGRMERWSYAEPGGAAVGLSAAMTLSEGPVNTLSVSGLRLNSWACGEEPAGVFSVREPSGAWHDVIFDGFVEEDEDEEPTGEPGEAVCDGCGVHMVGGEDRGAICADGAWMGDVFAGVSP